MKKQLISVFLSTTIMSSVCMANNLVDLDQKYYVSTSKLNVRSGEDISSKENIIGSLRLNDYVRVVSFGDNVDDQMVEIELIKSKSDVYNSSTKLFVSDKYLATKKTPKAIFKGRYFVIQNIATERLRVYERECLDNSCPHKMVLEVNMVAGENKDGRRTYLGSYKITRWNKFYQDNAGLYPSWYKEGYPAVPKESKGVLTWLKKKYMPIVDGEPKGDMRGAFGWYAGFVGPNSNAQWMHGTIGWGEKSKKFVKRTKGLLANILSDPRSHGCSRVDNMAIAYLKHLLPVGTPIVKVYAKEAFASPSLYRYTSLTNVWDYILTTVPGDDSDRNFVLRKGISSAKFLEEGTYEMDTYPDLVEYKKAGKLRNRSGKTGNIYNVSAEEFTNTGVYYVDTGLFENYRHPLSPNIKVGGYDDEVIPPFMDVKVLR